MFLIGNLERISTWPGEYVEQASAFLYSQPKQHIFLQKAELDLFHFVSCCWKYQPNAYQVQCLQVHIKARSGIRALSWIRSWWSPGYRRSRTLGRRQTNAWTMYWKWRVWSIRSVCLATVPSLMAIRRERLDSHWNMLGRAASCLIDPLKWSRAQTSLYVNNKLFTKLIYNKI